MKRVEGREGRREEEGRMSEGGGRKELSYIRTFWQTQPRSCPSTASRAVTGLFSSFEPTSWVWGGAEGGRRQGRGRRGACNTTGQPTSFLVAAATSNLSP